jgi:hypothetical protein
MRWFRSKNITALRRREHVYGVHSVGAFQPSSSRKLSGAVGPHQTPRSGIYQMVCCASRLCCRARFYS